MNNDQNVLNKLFQWAITWPKSPNTTHLYTKSIDPRPETTAMAIIMVEVKKLSIHGKQNSDTLKGIQQCYRIMVNELSTPFTEIGAGSYRFLLNGKPENRGRSPQSDKMGKRNDHILIKILHSHRWLFKSTTYVLCKASALTFCT